MGMPIAGHVAGLSRPIAPEPCPPIAPIAGHVAGLSRPTASLGARSNSVFYNKKQNVMLKNTKMHYLKRLCLFSVVHVLKCNNMPYPHNP